jgi:BASS family bile acid:Na+ symporter
VEATVLTQVVLPLALFVIMLGMGLSLKLDDFRRVARFPKAVALGVLGQMLVLPTVAWLVVSAFGMAPALGVGLMVLAFCPGGTTSNMISYLARGDLALSVTLTAVVSLVTPFTIPLLTGLAMTQLMGESQALALPFGKTILQLAVITFVPIALGMGIHKRWPRFAAAAEKPVKILSLLFLFLVIAGVVRQNWDELPGFFAQTGLAALTLNVVTMAIGFGLGLLGRLERSQSITLGIEVGIQNGTTALLVTGTLLANPTMSIAPAIYSLIMFGTGAVFGVLVNLGRGAPAAVEAEPAPERA